MEPLQPDDPARIGPYRTLARVRESASSVRFLALGPDGEATVVALVRPELAASRVFRRRFRHETRRTEQLAGGWVQPVTSDADGPLLWTASAYVPALTLREAIALAGPLSERTVRILGAALAETLSRVHATGTVLHGLSPDTVLLAADGPRLTALGALGAAVVAEADADGQLTVKLGYLTPEQATGAQPGPASDMFVLGQLLAYAATGTTPLADADRITHGEPELAGVPEQLRPVVASCLAKPPAERPLAGKVAAALALEGAAALARDGWLPAPVTSALAAQEAKARTLATGNADAAGTPGVRSPGGASVGGPVTGGTGSGRAAEEAGGTTGPTTAGASPVQPAAGADGAAHAATHHHPAAGKQGAAQAAAGAADGGHPATSAGHPHHDAVGAASSADEVYGTAAAGAHHHPAARGTGAARPTALGANTPHPATGPGNPAQPAAGDAGDTGDLGDRATVLVRRRGGPDVRDTTPMPVSDHTAPAVPALPAVVPFAGGTASRPEQDTGVARRGLLVAAAAGVAGLVVGGGAVYALGGDSEDKAGTGTPAPAPRPRRMAGLAPDPLWRYEHPAAGDGPVGAAVWRDRLLLVTDGERMTGVDLRTGRRRWELAEAASASRPVPVDTTFCLVDTADDLLWVSAEDGRTGHRVAKATLARPGESLTIGNVMGTDGSTVWFTGHVRKTVEKTVKKRKKKVDVRETYVIAYDLAGRRQLWRARVPDGRAPYTPLYQLVAARSGEVLVRQDGHTLTPAQRKAARNKTVLLAFDRGTGKPLASVPLGAVGATAAVTGDAAGRLYAASGGELHAYSGPDGKRQWRVTAADARGENEEFAFGTAVLRGPNLYAANRYQQVCAVDTATGRQLWRRSTEAPVWRETPSTVLSTSGRTVLAGDAAQLTAFSARDGRRLWKFQEAGAAEAEEQAAPRYTAIPAGGRRVLARRGSVFYALPVD
ncbi:PQQ-binding-like beta-propeller repeat protein [Streptomyces sp. ISL-10]|uniref:outer membrane protein assembly factor BamB family protein n=1 Tax=Streptomyces sp. ISL-10 TaxID=2819172 RepID=UPI001BEB94DF|nr:PQQ-binding-like beta-propeller repeat protein [Streptomyces sp. ISL-10]MBT2365349.1 PQQ-binding-like beta-propeller repeat protein [Streptomyces sp. ISL-10]